MNKGCIFANIKIMGKDGARFISALVVTLLLSAVVVFSGYQRERSEAAGSRVDFAQIQALIEADQLSFEEAEFYEIIEEPPR